jgi:hypothetical protein
MREPLQFGEYRRIVNRLFTLMIALVLFGVLGLQALIMVRSVELDQTRQELRRLSVKLDAVEQHASNVNAEIRRMVAENRGVMDLIVRLIRARPQDPHQE